MDNLDYLDLDILDSAIKAYFDSRAYLTENQVRMMAVASAQLVVFSIGEIYEKELRDKYRTGQANTIRRSMSVIHEIKQRRENEGITISVSKAPINKLIEWVKRLFKGDALDSSILTHIANFEYSEILRAITLILVEKYTLEDPKRAQILLTNLLEINNKSASLTQNSEIRH